MKKALYLLIVLAAIVSYFRVPFLFFQQDEIFTFSLFMSDGAKIILFGLGSDSLTHFAPLSLSISYLVYALFGLRYWIYNLLGLSFHILNGILIYKIARRVFKEEIPALITVLVFISSSAANELVMWPVISINSIALFFSLIAWLVVLDENLFTKFRGYSRGLFISFVFLLAMLSVEYSAGLILFIPAAIFLKDKVIVKDRLKLFIPFIITIIIYMLFKFIPLMSGGGFTGEGIKTGGLLPIRAFNLIVQYFGQIFGSQTLLLSLSHSFTDIFNPTKANDAFIENTVYRNFVTITGLMLIVITGLGLSRMWYKRNFLVKHFLAVFLFICFSALPYLLVQGQAGKFVIFPSRYLYFGLAGMSLYYGFVYYFAIKLQKKKILLISLLVILWVVISGIVGNFSRAKSIFEVGETRIYILQTISKLIASLPKKVIFYTESDTSYYGLPVSEKIMPFQSGFGRTLLVWFQKQENFSKDFFQGEYLWEITDEGYKEVGSRGFGYFRNFGKMADTVKKYQLDLSSIVSFRYDSESNFLEDMSQEVRGRVKGYLANKKLVNPVIYKLTASVSNKDINLAKDGNISTFWNSRIPYSRPQNIEILFNRPIRVAQLQINSYKDKDQNGVGYKVYVFGNDETWHLVFYSKSIPPDEGGIVNLYFEPQSTLRVKIEQVGYHVTASWVVNELKVYEETN